MVILHIFDRSVASEKSGTYEGFECPAPSVCGNVGVLEKLTRQTCRALKNNVNIGH
jgi:hypothetical protein